MTPKAATASFGRSFDSAGVPIRYVELGCGEPLVLVHSFTGSFDAQFGRNGLADALAQRHRVIGFDLRGHGASGKPHEPAQYGAQMAFDAVRLLDHLAIHRAHILGYSLGAHVVAQLLTLHPERFVTAILGGACGRRDWSAIDDARVAEEAAELERGELRTQLLRLWPRERPAPDEASLVAWSRRYLAGNDCHALAAVRRSNRHQVVTDAQLAAVDVPVLGIVGSDDPYLRQFRALSSILRDFTLDIIDGARHDDVPARPEFRAAVERFVAAHPVSAHERVR